MRGSGGGGGWGGTRRQWFIFPDVHQHRITILRACLLGVGPLLHIFVDVHDCYLRLYRGRERGERGRDGGGQGEGKEGARAQGSVDIRRAV